MSKRLWIVILAAGGLLLGCRPGPAGSSPMLTPTVAATVTTILPTAAPAATSNPEPPDSEAVALPPASPTPQPTVTSSPTPPPTPTPTITPTPTPIGPCAERVPADDLLILVTRQYGLGRDYEPADLAPLSDYFPPEVTLNYPTEVREVIIAPLQEMIADMQAAGLAPFIISGYRSYSAQAIAWSKWLEREGERGFNLSAPPGHSEHQLGTTVDFGSPELAEIVGDEEIEFHTYFFMTGEGVWLAENAHRYGFTLSYPREAFELTGFYYEPWHYRYVGVELATRLKEMGMFLTEYQLITQPEPCIP